MAWVLWSRQHGVFNHDSLFTIVIVVVLNRNCHQKLPPYFLSNYFKLLQIIPLLNASNFSFYPILYLFIWNMFKLFSSCVCIVLRTHVLGMALNYDLHAKSLFSYVSLLLLVVIISVHKIGEALNTQNHSKIIIYCLCTPSVRWNDQMIFLIHFHGLKGRFECLSVVLHVYVYFY